MICKEGVAILFCKKGCGEAQWGGLHGMWKLLGPPKNSNITTLNFGPLKHIFILSLSFFLITQVMCEYILVLKDLDNVGVTGVKCEINSFPTPSPSFPLLS